MKSRKPIKKTAQGKRMTDPDVRPLDQRENISASRKGMKQTKFEEVRGVISEYKQAEIF
jgi:hypothetical protein